jgi:hypothetical protein
MSYPSIAGLSRSSDQRASIRRAGWIAGASLLALATLALSAGPMLAAGDKYFVCKYVGTPGVDETLQTGQNPISVSENAIPGTPVVGTFFNDSQGRSYVLALDTGQPEPPASACPLATPAPTPTPTPTPVPAANPTPTPVAMQLPNTATVDTATSRTDGYLWQLALAGFAGLLAAALVLSPVFPLLVKRIRR